MLVCSLSVSLCVCDVTLVLSLEDTEGWLRTSNTGSARKVTVEQYDKQTRGTARGCYLETNLEAKVVVVKVSVVNDLAVQPLRMLHKSKSLQRSAEQTAQQ